MASPSTTMGQVHGRAMAVVLALRVWAGVVIGLQLLAQLLPESLAWGLTPAVAMPATIRWPLALAALTLALAGPRLPLPNRMPWGRWWARAVLALAAGMLFVLFPLNHLKWGDAKILFEAIPHPTFHLTYVWQAPFDVFLHAKAWALGNRLFGWPNPVPAYRIIGCAAGVLFVWLLLGLVRWLGRNRSEYVLLAGLVVTLGTMELFFGYIENYSLMTVGVLLYCYLALRTLAGKTHLVWSALTLALTHAFHPGTIILAPSLLFVAYQVVRREGCSQRAWMRAALSVALPMIGVFGAVVALMTTGKHGLDALLGVDFPGGGDRRWFVPLFQITTEWEHYTMFSSGHLIDIINEQLLVAPVVWPALIICAVFARSRLPWRDDRFHLLLFMAVSYLLLTLVWNPDYGGQKDWDLFAPAAIPAALLLGYVLPRVLPERRALAAASWALLASQGYHLILWVFRNTLSG